MGIELMAYQGERKKWISSFLLFTALFLVGCSESVPVKKEVSVNGNVQNLISQMEFGNCDSVLALLENNKLVLENPLQDKLLQINCLYLKGELKEAIAAMDSFLMKPITHTYTQAVAQKLKGVMFYENGDVTSALRAWI